MEQILIKKRKSYGVLLQQATSSSMLRHLVSELNNPNPSPLERTLDFAPPKLYRGGYPQKKNYIEEVWEGSDCYACYCRMIRSRNVVGVALLFGSKLWKPRLARRFHAII